MRLERLLKLARYPLNPRHDGGQLYRLIIGNAFRYPHYQPKRFNLLFTALLGLNAHFSAWPRTVRLLNRTPISRSLCQTISHRRATLRDSCRTSSRAVIDNKNTGGISNVISANSLSIFKRAPVCEISRILHPQSIVRSPLYIAAGKKNAFL